ncbi:hypothetical protein GH714_007379 [Hevea brasiliensis]|uniref:Vacuolar ATPase assembly protein VMA22 n=1 Tax=Hevea brasiliensis TaxID=3981 RepID=A0A6A6M910_HEVBR|nr:hypothetical protein GH714_007379 [Hevea brasiliensis]
MGTGLCGTPLKSRIRGAGVGICGVGSETTKLRKRAGGGVGRDWLGFRFRGLGEWAGLLLGFGQSDIVLLSLKEHMYSGWLELVSARHSMGASRVNSSLLDLKVHSASTSLQVTPDIVDSMEEQPHFILRKWGSLYDGKCSYEDQNSKVDGLQGKSGSPLPRIGENPSFLVQKKRSRSLSVFGTLVSPQLRAAQLSFETALETLVEIANMRSTMLSTFNGVHKELGVAKEIR